MQVALIPPYSKLGALDGRLLHMMLPACLGNDDYRKVYDPETRPKTSYVVLDNDMFESGSSVDYSDLIEMAMTWKVDEVISPDVAGDWKRSLDLHYDFCRYVHSQLPSAPFKIMRVLQGATPGQMLDSILSLEHDPFTDVIGFPRKITEDGAATARIDAMERVVRRYGSKYRMHMLGTSRAWPREIMYAQRQFGPWIRGVDTSAPFVWAYSHEKIQEVDNVDRTPDYFELPADAFPDELLGSNIKIVDQWSGGLYEMGWISDPRKG